MPSERVSPFDSILVKALAAIRNGPNLLVEKYPTSEGAPCYRPLGGGIHFGERAVDAVQREIREEIGAELENVAYLAAFESIFDKKGRLLHLIEVVFTAELADHSFHLADTIIGTEGCGKSFEAVWIDISRPFGGQLIPVGLLELLSASLVGTSVARQEETSKQLSRVRPSWMLR